MPKEPKTPNSVLTEESDEEVKLPDYTSEEEEYLKGIRKRLENARDGRDKNHEEFDGLTFINYWWANERWGNTYIRPVANKGEQRFQSGTLRTKMDSVTTSIGGLNLGADISAFDEHDMPIQALGDGVEDIMDKTNEVEMDDEKKSLRQYEMFKHGYVFVEDIWDKRYEIKKTVTGKLGDIKGVKITTRMVQTLAMPKRTIIPGPCVYLGSMKKYMSTDQPFIFTIERMDWHDAKKIYKDFDRWNNVPRKTPATMIDTNWRLLLDLKNEDEVEIIRYQDKPNNEFQIFINSVPMLPIGFPLTEITGDGEYTIVQQNLEPIRHDFAYGKSFVFKHKNLVAVLDQMMRLGVMKTLKSFIPPKINTSERVISRDIFMPGKITRGIKKGEVSNLEEEEAKGVTASEFAMIQEMIQAVDRNTVSQTTTGAKEKGGKVTATQIIQLQKQAKIMMGKSILAAVFLEKKLAIKRMGIILRNWFNPFDQVVDKARNVLKNKYRIVSRERSINDKGPGMRFTIPTDQKLPSSQQVRGAEDQFEKTSGFPIKLIFLNPDELKQAKLTWIVNVNPKEKRSSELSKIMFGSMLADGINLGLRFNPDYVEERFAQVWDEDPTKLFLKGEQAIQQPQEGQETKTKPRTVSPQMKVPVETGGGTLG